MRKMLVTQVDQHGAFVHWSIQNPIFHEYVGKQRDLGKFLTNEKVACIKQALRILPCTTYTKASDRDVYNYVEEPTDGDFDAEEFSLDRVVDGREEICALLHDFCEQEGEIAKAGEEFTSTAFIQVKT